jgi:D-alanine-D-alanine ligase
MMTKKRVVVLFGGMADEHSISCISACGILKAMDTALFEPIPIGITKSGEWLFGCTDPRDFNLEQQALPTVEPTSRSRRVVLDLGAGKDGFFVREPVAAADGTQSQALRSLGRIDAILPALHGPYGEDGTVQGLLDMMKVPYVGCGVFASAACMDKHFTKVLLHSAGIRIAPGFTVDTREFDAASHFYKNASSLQERIHAEKLRYPLFVKPSRAGSSFGVTKIEPDWDAEQLAEAVFEASRHDWKVLIEQGVDGREIECAVLSPDPTGEPQASWPGEIVLDRKTAGNDQFYDFDSKYTDTEASHVEVPAHLPETVLQRVRETAIRAFKAVDGTGLSRVDTFVDEQGNVTVNEINTMPGFTPISMYPKAWEATGVNYTELITRLITGVLQ